MNENEIKEILNGKYKKIEEVDTLDFFHPNGITQTILRNDDYFLGHRADHFIIVDGSDEEYDEYDESKPYYSKTGAFILICNHKGDTIIEFYIGWK